MAVHRRLERADRIDLGHRHARARAAQRLRRALAHVAITADDGDLARHHHVGGAADAVHEAFAAAIAVVELRFRHAVVDVDAGEGQHALLLHLVEAENARRRLLGHALDAGLDLGIPARRALEARLDGLEQALLFLAFRVPQHGGVLLGLSAKLDDQRGVAAIVEDHVCGLSAGPFQDAVHELPIFVEVLAFEGEDRRASCGDGGGGVVLRREDVARRPANVRADRLQALDQHGRLDRHVQAARDARALQRLLFAVLLAHGHQARHLSFGDIHLLAAPFRKADVFHVKIGRDG